MKKIFISIILIFINHACFEQSTPPLIISTFNIAWLGDNLNDKIPRNTNTHKLITDLISFSNSKIIALQEIENQQALDHIHKYLPNFNTLISSDTNPQKNALLLHKSIKIDTCFDYATLKLNNPKLRPALIADIHIDSIPITLIALHLKSTSRYDSTPSLKAKSKSIRLSQCEILRHICDSLLTLSKNIIMLGDFNDSPLRKNNSLAPLINHQQLHCLTHQLKSCKFHFLQSIDHIIISKSLMPYYIDKSARIINQFHALPQVKAHKISDHCPVSVAFLL